METGKTGRYFKYAIGEIILVVIGILIALQINNWNEGKKEDQRGIELLQNIKSDYDKNKIRLNTAKEESAQINYDSRYFMELISKEAMTAPYDTLIKYGSAMINVTRFSPLNSSYITAQSTGDIGLIKDKELLELFIEYQEALEWLNFHVELSGNMVYSGDFAEMRKRLGSYFVLLGSDNPDPYPTEFNLTEDEYRSFFLKKENFSTLESFYWINRNILKSIDSMLEINNDILLKIEVLLNGM